MNDLKFALRQLLKYPGFTAVAVLTLSLGIGANTAIFSVINAVLLRPPPFHQPDQLAFLSEKSRDIDNMSVSYPNFRDWERQQEFFTSLGAFRSEQWNLTGTERPERLTGTERPERLTGLQVSAGFFRTLGVAPLLGRVFTADEDRVGGPRVVLLGERLWRGRFGADPEILNRPISLDGLPHTVVGILPAAFQFPQRVQLWVPLGHQAEWTEKRGWHPGIYVVARLRDDIAITAARTGMEAIAARLGTQFPDTNAGNGVHVLPLHERLAGPGVRRALVTLLGAVLAVLLIACTNVTNLLLARATHRRREIAVRLALGATRWQLLRQLMIESLLLAAAGGLAGLLLAQWGITALAQLLPVPISEMVTLNIDRTVLLFSLAIATTTGFLFGLAPAWQLSRGEPMEALQQGGRSQVSPHTGGRGRHALIVGEVALALLLLVAAGLLLRSFGRLQAVPVGLDPAHVLTMELSLPPYKYPDDAQRARFYQRAVETVAALPGVRSAAFVSPLPLGFGGWQTSVRLEGEPPALPGKARMTDYALVTPDYFKTLGISLLKGRPFSPADTGTNRVCIVDETFERTQFAGDALGKRLAIGNDGTNWMTIVGVSRHVKNYGAGESSRIETYEPVTQNAGSSMTLVLKTDGPPLSLAEPARRAILSVDPDQPVDAILTMDQILVRSTAEKRLATTLLGLFAALALTLAAVGLYGLMAFNVANRTREIGVRMALGAQTTDVLALVLRQGAALIALGVALGLAAALGATQWMKSLLFEIGPTDLPTYIATPALLAVVALAACWLPARRAARVDPMQALRCE